MQYIVSSLADVGRENAVYHARYHVHLKCQCNQHCRSSICLHYRINDHFNFYAMELFRCFLTILNLQSNSDIFVSLYVREGYIIFGVKNDLAMILLIIWKFAVSIFENFWIFNQWQKFGWPLIRSIWFTNHLVNVLRVFYHINIDKYGHFLRKTVTYFKKKLENRWLDFNEFHGEVVRYNLSHSIIKRLIQKLFRISFQWVAFE